MPKGRRSYCSDRCVNREKQRRRRARLSKEQKLINDVLNQVKPRSGENRGAVFDMLLSSELGLEIMQRRMTQREVADQLGVSQTQISEAMGAIRRHYARALVIKDWQPSDEHAAMLLQDEEPDIDDEAAFDDFLERAIHAFAEFRQTFFHTAKGPYYTEEFHLKWIKGILRAMYTGGQLMILSPPRHGKSELLVHFCVWLICRNPNIQILWVSGNEDIASIMVGMVKSQLEDNQALREAYLPPGDTWQPEGRGGRWRDDEFIVANRDSTLVKSPTMIAVGRGGKILSRDADLIVTDDVEDHKSTQIPSMRESTRGWVLQDLDSRKEEHTAWVIIGSHQHSDGLYVYLLDDEAWEVIVDMAHNYVECHIDPNDIEAHVDCMLFPRLRTYRWLRRKQMSARALGKEDLWELVYLQKTHGKGHTVFDKTEMEACYNKQRTLGKRGLPADYRLIAGLDPSSTGYQSAFLWAYSTDTSKIYMIDVDNTHGGGVDNALDLMKHWLKTYGCRYWVIEENGFQKAIRLNRDVKEWAARNNVWLEGHETQGTNKHDPLFGVGAMAGLYRGGLVDLPYAGTTAQEKTLSYVKQAINFDGLSQRTRKRGIKSDILMASWFPWKIISRWIEDDLVEEESEEFEEVFASYDGMDYGEAPW